MTAEHVRGRAPTVRFEHDDHITVITLDRPERLNAVKGALVRDLCDALGRAGEELPSAVVPTVGGRADRRRPRILRRARPVGGAPLAGTPAARAAAEAFRGRRGTGTPP